MGAAGAFFVDERIWTMAQSFPDFTPPVGVWTDLVAAAGYEALAGVKATIQYKGGYEGRVYFGGAAAPGADDGGVLAPMGSVTGSADHIWVKARGSMAGAFYAQEEDA